MRISGKKLREKKYVFRDGIAGKKYKVNLCEKPITHSSFTTDFAMMIQLFRNITNYLDFSHPFRVVIEYDPERRRVKTKLYMPLEVLQRYIQRPDHKKDMPEKERT